MSMSNAAIPGIVYVQVFVWPSGSADVNFCRVGSKPVMAWPLSAARYPTHIDMVAKAAEVAERKLGAGNFCHDIEVSTPETRKAKVAELMSRCPLAKCLPKKRTKE